MPKVCSFCSQRAECVSGCEECERYSKNGVFLKGRLVDWLVVEMICSILEHVLMIDIDESDD